MASVVCVCAVMLLAAIGQATNIIKGLYCQDPDTGKLYPVNTTWPSQTFCGNYICKLRKKNTTETEYAPLHKINITKYHILNNDKEIGNNMISSSSDKSFVLTEKTDKNPIFHKDLLNTTTVKESKPNSKNIIKDNDEYLSESEIKKITDMLHTVKKSDLEALVDIYNLAQDIYKDIDDVDKKEIISKDPNTLRKIESVNDDKQSYWYDSVHKHKKIVDMSREETNVISTNKPHLPTKPSFFKGPLTPRDFGKVPYYYPISNFQRLSSYMRTNPNINDLEKASTETKPCSKAAPNYNYGAIPKHDESHKKPHPTPSTEPSTLLPYPYSYIYHYNINGNPPNYYYNYPWAHGDSRRHRNYPQPYYGAYIVQIPSYGVYNNVNIQKKEDSSESNNTKENFLKTLKPASNKSLLPDWQTAPLSQSVLDEVRAHLERPKSLKSIKLKNNIKLEKLGKVLKLDEITRVRRELESDDHENDGTTSNDVELEAYVERTMCENSMEPGYFSVGNMSQPYPACCPQKLERLHIAREVIKIN